MGELILKASNSHRQDYNLLGISNHLVYCAPVKSIQILAMPGSQAGDKMRQPRFPNAEPCVWLVRMTKASLGGCLSGLDSSLPCSPANRTDVRRQRPQARPMGARTTGLSERKHLGGGGPPVPDLNEPREHAKITCHIAP